MAGAAPNVAAVIGGDVSPLVSALDQGKQALGKFGKDVDDNAATLAKWGAAAAGAAALAVSALVKAQIDVADSTSKASKAAGISTENFSKLSYAMSLGVEGGGDLSKTLLFLNKAIASGADEFKDLGVETKNADGSFRSADAVLMDIADSMAMMGDGAQKAEIATKLLGKTGADLVPMLSEGSKGLRALGDEAQRAGQVIDAETGKAAEQFNDQLTRLKAQTTGLGNELMKGLLPALTSTTDALLDDNSALNSTIKTVAEAAGVYAVVTIALNAKTIALRAAAAAQALFNVAAKANPYAIAAAGLGLLVAAIHNYNKAVPEAVKRTEEASTAMSRFDAITRRAKDAIDAQNRSAAGMTLPKIKEKIADVNKELGMLNTLQRRATRDFERGAVSAGLVKSYDEQIALKKKQVDDLSALLGTKQAAQDKKDGIKYPKAAKVEKAQELDYQYSDEAIMSFVALEGEAQAKSIEAQRIASIEKLNIIGEQYASEEDKLTLKLETENAAVANALALNAITKEQADQLELENLIGFESAKSEIEKREADKRTKQAEMEAAAKKAILSKAFNGLTSLMNSGSRKMFEIGKAAAISSSIVSTYQGIAEAWKLGPVLGPIGAAMVGLAGFANVQSIRAQSFGGGGSAGGGGAMSNTQAINAASTPVRAENEQTQRTNINLTGEIFSRDSVIGLLNAALGDGYVLGGT
mgnify:CR=1 FL=1